MGFRERYARFMLGRYGAYGPDRLSRAINFAAIALIVASLFVRYTALNITTLALVAFSLFRLLSRNYEARQRENAAYAKIADKFAPPVRRAAKGARRKVKTAATRIRYFRTHRFYGCAKCGSRLRVPRVRGRLQISCPKCGGTFIAGGRAAARSKSPKLKKAEK